jgi:RecA/RadA recombinase
LVACGKTDGIVSRNSSTEFTLTSRALGTLPLDSGSALVEAEEKKDAQGNASMPAAVTLCAQAVRQS